MPAFYTANNVRTDSCGLKKDLGKDFRVGRERNSQKARRIRVPVECVNPQKASCCVGPPGRCRDRVKVTWKVRGAGASGSRESLNCDVCLLDSSGESTEGKQDQRERKGRSPSHPGTRLTKAHF